jgi:hypothetical protein
MQVGRTKALERTSWTSQSRSEPFHLLARETLRDFGSDSTKLAKGKPTLLASSVYVAGFAGYVNFGSVNKLLRRSAKQQVTGLEPAKAGSRQLLENP